MPPVYCTIDSVSMQHLCRPAVVTRTTKRRTTEKLGIEIISSALHNNDLIICLDDNLSIPDEWIKTCGMDIITPILSHWFESGRVMKVICEKYTIPVKLNAELKKYQFKDSGDRLIVRLGLASGNPSFYIATNDSDFWNPLDKKMAGKPSAPIATALRVHGVYSTQLKEFFNMIPL